MKKMSIVAICAAVFATAANAGFVSAQPVSSAGGFIGNETIVTVKQAKDMRDDTYVVMQGKIVSQVKGDKYTFEDGTGSITVEIDDDDWRGQTVSPSDTVKIYGEVDRGFMNVEIDVDTIQKM
ncbi:MAG: NirD/YgiW/YdeI family stress tolerance protein [Alphaproteobacteria bacterium]|nr:NirD/YgiW/YdeI family stress tolerance protein [Alphaproteobacteria bacterium]